MTVVNRISTPVYEGGERESNSERKRKRERKRQTLSPHLTVLWILLVNALESLKGRVGYINRLFKPHILQKRNEFGL